MYIYSHYSKIGNVPLLSTADMKYRKKQWQNDYENIKRFY